MNNGEKSNLILSYNVRKDCPKLFAIILFSLAVITIIVILMPYFEIKKGMEIVGAIVALIISLICFELPLGLAVIAFINTKLEIYENRVEYINFFRKKKILNGNISEIEISGYFGYGMLIYNTKTNEEIRTHFLTKSIFLIKKCKDNNVKII